MALSVAPYSYGRPVGGRALNQHRNFVASYIDPLIAFVSANAWLAYLTLFLAALLEAVPVVGSVIPGSTVILALSALVPSGELKLQGGNLAAHPGLDAGELGVQHAVDLAHGAIASALHVLMGRLAGPQVEPGNDRGWNDRCQPDQAGDRPSG